MNTSTPSELLANAYDFKLEAAKEYIVKFQAKLEDDPAYAFSWGQDAITAAAEIKVFSMALAILDSEGDVLKALEKEALDHVVRAARHPACSTSAISNITEQQITAAWARVLEDLSRLG